ncbi:hypothetical protein [Sedimentitalea todarodis]|uniref:Uncharacterized protein n=1 Tax=Sedimentitalea todarodis TaxID=1631240 RepID=A0ABU3VLK2_9RHOB|nr:hypothetical protein [Sedimentitalea todarodis]MDU9007062.1 hypothetical protein [Sedimentitalea todarodis]
MLNAETIVYECEYNHRDRGGWFSRHASFAVSWSEHQAVIVDAAVLHANRGKPVSVPVEVRKNGVYIIRWALNLPTSSSYEVDAQYRVRLDPRTLRVSANVNVNDDMDHIGAGKCTANKLQ